MSQKNLWAIILLMVISLFIALLADQLGLSDYLAAGHLGIAKPKKVLALAGVSIFDNATGEQNIILQGNDLRAELSLVSTIDKIDLSKSGLSIINPAGRQISFVPLSPASAENLEPGDQQLLWSTANIAAGVYFAKITVCTVKRQCRSELRKFVIAPTAPDPTRKNRVDLELQRAMPPKLEVTALLQEEEDSNLKKCELLTGDNSFFTAGKRTFKVKPAAAIHEFKVGFASEGLKWLQYHCVNKQGITYSSPRKHIYLSRAIKADKDSFFDILFVPIGWSRNETNSFRDASWQVYSGFLQILRDNDLPIRANFYTLEPKDCAKKPIHIILDGLDVVFSCARRSPLAGIFDMAVGLCKIGNCPSDIPGLGRVLGIAQLPDKPLQEQEVANIVFYSHPTPATKILAHEAGHNFGFYHINDFEFIADVCNPLTQVCLACAPALGACQGINRSDCQVNRQERRQDLMTYCPLEVINQYGPAAKEYLRNLYLKPYLE